MGLLIHKELAHAVRLRILACRNDLNRKRGRSPKYLCIGIYLHPCYIMDNSCFKKADGGYMPILKVPKRYELTKRSGRFRRNMTRQEKHIWYDYLRKLPFAINRQMIIGSYIVQKQVLLSKLMVYSTIGKNNTCMIKNVRKNWNLMVCKLFDSPIKK